MGNIAGSGYAQRQRVAWGPAFMAFGLLECLIMAQVYTAYQDHFLTVAQMREGGVSQGLPLIWHFGIWSDLLLISPLAAYLIGQYLARWNLLPLLASVGLGIVSAGFLNLLYIQSDQAEAHVRNHNLTTAGTLHLIYMAVAIAVFVQFLYFTRSASLSLLRTVSVLLFAHVLFGTHMILGILKWKFRLDWYPTQPLESGFGWITIATIGIALASRNWGIALVLYFLNQRYRTAEEYLRLLDRLCNVVNLTYFLFAIEEAWRRNDSFSAMILIALLGIIYYLSRLSVLQELEIGKSLYPPDRIPDELQLRDRVKITLQVSLFMLLYLLLGWVAHCILVASFCMLVIACIDLNTRRQINKNMQKFFGDPYYAPLPIERIYQPMMNRRAIAEWYLLKLPHLGKEATRIAGCALAFGIANYTYFSNVPRGSAFTYFVDNFHCAVFGEGSHGNQPAYIVLILTLVGNEALTQQWRMRRDRKLQRL